MGNAERSALGGLGLMNLYGLHVRNSHRIPIALVQQVTGLATLDSGKDPTRGEYPVFCTLVGTVAVDSAGVGSRRSPALGDGFPVECIVGCCCTFHLHVCNQRWGILPVSGPGDVHAVALQLLLTLLAVPGIRVVGVLEAGGGDGPLVTWRYSSMLDDVLFIEHALELHPSLSPGQAPHR